MIPGIEAGPSSEADEAMSDAPQVRTAKSTIVVDLSDDRREMASLDSAFMKQDAEFTLMMYSRNPT